MTKTDIYIGLNDQDTKTQKFEITKYVSILKKVCVSYKAPFSVHRIEGGYLHESGEYTEENTLVLSLTGVDRDVIREIATDLCVFFHQESVLVTESEVRAYSIRAGL